MHHQKSYLLQIHTFRFEEFWDINASVQAVTTVLDELSPQTVTEIRSNVEREQDYDSNGSVVVHGHANAIKGIV